MKHLKIKNNRIAIKILAMSFWLLLPFAPSYGQGRDYIKEQMQQVGHCRNVAITKTGGDLILYGLNGYATFGCPFSLIEAIEELYDEEVYLDDIQLTEKDRWLILYDDNGLLWNDIPYSLETCLDNFVEQKEVITSVTFNDANDWIVVTTKFYAASNNNITNWLKEGSAKYGPLLTASIADDAIVAVYQGGYRYLGNVPQSLQNALEKTRLKVYRVKMAGTSWFFADKDGTFDYNM